MDNRSRFADAARVRMPSFGAEDPTAESDWRIADFGARVAESGLRAAALTPISRIDAHPTRTDETRISKLGPPFSVFGVPHGTGHGAGRLARAPLSDRQSAVRRPLSELRHP
jgi:hypothetical protein